MVPAKTKPESAVIASVPLLDLKRQYATIRDEVLTSIERVCDSQQFILGAEVAEFEREVSAFTGAGHTVACASGTDALWLALVAAGVQPGDSVLTTPFSFFATASAIVRAGARPVFADVDPETLNLDPAKVARQAQSLSNLRAVMPVHLYGQCADMDAFSQLAAELKIANIEDAAQAFGASWRGRRAGVLGTAGCFSFYPTKNLSAYGDAGCVTTSDAAMAQHMRRLRDHGSSTRYLHDEIGWNSRLDAIQAAVLRVKLKYIEKWNQQRRERAASYDHLLADSGLLQSGTSRPAPVRRLRAAAQAFHIYHQYVLRVAQRDQLRAFLKERNIGTEIYYPVPLHLQECFVYLGYRTGDLPESERAAQEVLALPIFPELSEDEQTCVVENIATFYS
jgi:dTDP-4-amino-4,6-dideoxygalactose transaminase